jgi:hypothetical protein
MSEPYRVFVRKEAFNFLATRRLPERERALRFLDLLANAPHRRGDYSEKDDAGRPLEVVVEGRLAIVFWSDHAAKEVKIVEIRFADR